MINTACPLCGSEELSAGYGYAAGPLGAYEFCDECDELIFFGPDTEGLPDAEAEAANARQQQWQADFDARVAQAKAKRGDA